jgi:hypothetical protein
MSRRSYQRYTPEFKEQDLALLALGKPVTEVTSLVESTLDLAGANTLSFAVEDPNDPPGHH